MFTPPLAELRRSIETALGEWLDFKRSELPEAVPLLDEIERIARAGGKRLRPAFCYWGYRAGGGAHSDEVIRAAAALELLHTFALVHDDIMDAAEERRGQPSVHAKHGVAFAILVGDLALVLADGLLMRSGFPVERLSGAFAAYSRMREQVIAGQYLDVAAVDKPELGEEDARRIALLKSGLYSIEEPMAIGALLAGAPGSLLEGLSRFGRPLGEAFQLRDDLLGTFGDPRVTGKPVDSDIRQGKRNVLYARMVAALGAPDRDLVIDAWGKGGALSDAEVARLRNLIESSGARRGIEDLLGKLRDEALAALNDLAIDPQPRAALAHLAEIATADA